MIVPPQQKTQEYSGLATVWAPEAQDSERSKQEEEEKAPPARQNTILRDYFRRQYGSFFQDRYYRASMPNRLIVERYVDRQIDHFLEELERDLNALEEKMSQTRRLWNTPVESRAEDARFRKTLNDLGDRAEAIRDRLSRIFRNLDSKTAFEPPKLDSALSQKELDFLQQHVAMGIAAIRGYLLLGSHVVSLQQLEEERMLASLYLVKKMVDYLRDTL